MANEGKTFIEACSIKGGDFVFVVPGKQELSYNEFDPEGALPYSVLYDAESVNDSVAGPLEEGPAVEIAISYFGEVRHFIVPARMLVRFTSPAVEVG